jgi:hypothetical protein
MTQYDTDSLWADINKQWGDNSVQAAVYSEVLKKLHLAQLDTYRLKFALELIAYDAHPCIGAFRSTARQALDYEEEKK